MKMITTRQSTTCLQAGAAQVDITPGSGVHLSGDVGKYRPARLVEDPIYARAVVLSAHDAAVCIVVLDVTIVTREYADRIRQAAAEIVGCSPDAVMVCATQTHSAPSLGYFMLDDDFPELPPEFEWLRGSEKAYGDWAEQQAVKAVQQAFAAREPVQLGAASGIEGRWAFNRRAVRRDGKVGMPGRTWPAPLGPTWISHIEGPMDPELGVMCLRNDALKFTSLLVHHTCHPVHVFPKPFISPDWPGAVVSALQGHYGAGCVPMVLNGACGNINPWPPFDPDYADDCRLMGKSLAETAARVIETMEFTGEATVDGRSTFIQLPLRDLTDDELQWAQEVLKRSPLPTWADEAHTMADPHWVTAAGIYSVYLQKQREGMLNYEVQVLRIGDTAIVGLPGEPFVEGQLAVKAASPAAQTYVAHCASQYVGYLPTREALTRGGHEVNTRYWAKLAPEALELVVAGTTDLLALVFAPRS